MVGLAWYPMTIARHITVWRTRLRVAVAAGKALARAGFGLTPRERDGVLLVSALFVFGLGVQWLHWFFQIP